MFDYSTTVLLYHFLRIYFYLNVFSVHHSLKTLVKITFILCMALARSYTVCMHTHTTLVNLLNIIGKDEL